jgi:hypothetical protein
MGGQAQGHPLQASRWLAKRLMSDRQYKPASQFRLAELLVALSLVADLAMGHEPEEAVSACFLATQTGPSKWA